MASGLPSYQEATSRATDWWGFVAPYVQCRDYPRLCLVSTKTYGHFAPRLWNDPLSMVRLLGLDRHDELGWYLGRFLPRSVRIARLTTRRLVLSLDFRDFAAATADFLSDEVHEALDETLRSLPTLFPSLRCLLLDGHPFLNPLVLARALLVDDDGRVGSSPSPLWLLSIAGCRGSELPASYFASRSLRNLVYLDVSHLPGSLATAIEQRSFGRRTLPSLRVLRCRGREMDGAAAHALTAEFRHQLWSLDLGDNALCDVALLGVVAYGLPPGMEPLGESHPSRFAVEGRLSLDEQGLWPDEFGPFVSVVESEWSATASHPQRHLVDAPTYEGPEDPDGVPVAVAESREGMRSRADGTVPFLSDEPLGLVRALAGGTGSLAPDVAEALASRPCQGFRGITHLSVDGNRLTLAGICRALLISGGILERFDCDLALMQPQSLWSSLPRWFARSCKVFGILGASYLVRPVVSSSLRVLRMHHSLVTQTPTIATEGAVSAADAWMAETFLAPRAELAYPGAFVPDMNPRLTSLTLTDIPRRSAGPVVEGLRRFLSRAYEQERMIAEAAVSGSRRSPAMLTGLRHVRLEFASDSAEESDLFVDDDEEGYDPGSIMDQPASEFSFFREWKPTARSEEPPSATQFPQRSQDTAPVAQEHVPTRGQPSGRTPHFPFDAAQGSYVDQTVVHDGRKHTVPVWIGPGEPGPHPAVNAYMRNLADATLRASGGVGPATPHQVLAGAPPGSFLFQHAWMAILFSPLSVQPAPDAAAGTKQLHRLQQQHVLRRPTRRELATTTRDIVAELKAFRQEERLAGRHWSGRLEVAYVDSRSRVSRFWR